MLLSVVADLEIGRAHMVYVRHDPDGGYKAGGEYTLEDGRRCVVRDVVRGDTYLGDVLSRIYAMKRDGGCGMWHDLQYLLFVTRAFCLEDGKAQAQREQRAKEAAEPSMERLREIFGRAGDFKDDELQRLLSSPKLDVSILGQELLSRIQENKSLRAKIKERDREIRRLRKRPLPRTEKGLVVKDEILEGEAVPQKKRQERKKGGKK